MHFVCAPIGSSGDVHPMLGLALVLQERGHRVTVITSGYFGELIRRRGLTFQELGTKQEFLDLTAREELWKPLVALQYIYQHGLEPTMRRHYDMLSEHRGEGPIVSISSMFGFGARVAQEKLGIPLVTLHLQPSVIWSDIEPPQVAGMFGPRWLKQLTYRLGERLVVDRAVCPSLNAWRDELGLAPVHRITRWWHSPECVACFFPTWFAKPQSDWPQNLIQTGFPLWDEPVDGSMPREVEAFLAAGDPPIAFTPGSANVFGGKFFRAAVDTCRQQGRRGLLLTRFAEQLPRDLPSTVMHVPYVPFSQLLPRCAALVHHGGIGSMAQAIAAGLPQLVVAMAHDQFDNGSRVKRLGIGEWMNCRNVSSRRMTNSLTRLLDSHSVAQRCRELAGRIATSDSLTQMAAAIEQHVATNPP